MNVRSVEKLKLDVWSLGNIRSAGVRLSDKITQEIRERTEANGLRK